MWLTRGRTFVAPSASGGGVDDQLVLAISETDEVYASASSEATAHAAPTSMGSPSDVPVPCICSAAIQQLAPSLAALGAPRLQPWSDRAARITACCDGPLGAVSVLDRPSWFTPDPASA